MPCVNSVPDICVCVCVGVGGRRAGGPEARVDRVDMIPPSFHTWLITPVADAILAACPPAGRPDLSQKLFLPSGLRQLLPTAALYREVLDNPRVADALTHSSRRPPVHWEPDQPVHRHFCNYGAFARSLTHAEYARLAHPDTACECHRYPGLCPPGVGHVMSTSPFSALPDGARPFWTYGARYRPHLPVRDVDAVIRKAYAGALRYTQELAKRQGVAAGETAAWAGEFEAALRRAVHAHRGFQFPWPVLSDTDLAGIRDLDPHFIITVTDKSSSTLQLVCKKYYATCCMRDLGCHDLFATPPATHAAAAPPLPPPPPPPAAPNAATAPPPPPPACARYHTRARAAAAVAAAAGGNAADATDAAAAHTAPPAIPAIYGGPGPGPSGLHHAAQPPPAAAPGPDPPAPRYRTRAQAATIDADAAAAAAADAITAAAAVFDAMGTADDDAHGTAAAAAPPLPAAPAALYYEPTTAAGRDAHYATTNATLVPWHLSLDATQPPAYYAGTLKMHKQPPSMRYLACSQQCPVTALSDVVTAVLRAASPCFTAHWQRHLPGTAPWLCFSSGAVMSLVAQFNAAHFQPHAAHPHVARDFSRLYTNLPHSDLRTTLHRLLTASLADTPAIRVTTRPPNPLRPRDKPRHAVTFLTAVERPYHAAANGSVTREFSVHAFCTIILDALLSSTFIRFGPALVRQICGIPMGISAAPFIANLFLGWYEFEFMRQSSNPSLSPAARAILRRFRFTKRYLDDLLCLNNPWLPHLLYNDRTYEGLAGLYPPTLAVPAQTHEHLPSHCIPFLDVLLCSTVHNHRCWIVTHLYDKREQPAFQHVRLSRFVARHSSVNEQCKRNIFTGQSHRLRRVITCGESFSYETAMLIRSLEAQQYARASMLGSLGVLLRQHPHVFYFQRRGVPQPPHPPDVVAVPRLDLLARVRHYLRGHAGPPPPPPV
ncbi:hypothetical protein CHLRE_16g672945v5 [Chlamydomonas reinhardtii]|uniref:Reverse transcriptase domain-containing protein n=1 Tax=Chlamydomonas reinhardtii TaxID=3055 RepID=A0A2K3CVR3_CHLRE|nr:uncharacterized protein CHLRE_16g672945v5 [Chlamydomonas reinhardtii]PNW72368.1 hypothetical protein CHLRE_16g672945v5 [Chlamydomonas reinhardtii]